MAGAGVVSRYMEDHDLKQLAHEILREGFLMSLGTTDDEGVWVSDVIYVHDEDLCIYWVSLPSARHSQAIGAGSRVACNITSSHVLGKERALQIAGTAEPIEGSRLELEQMLEAKRGKEVPQVAGEILSRGHVWYVLKPDTTKLIDSDKFGYERKTIEIML